MASPILGDSPSRHERPERKQLGHMSLEKHRTGLLVDAPTDTNLVTPGNSGKLAFY